MDISCRLKRDGTEALPWVETWAAQSSAQLLPGWFLAHWQDLAQRSPHPDPFCFGPVWNLAYHQALNCGREIYYAASEQGALIFGLARTLDGEPMYLPLEDSWFYGCPLPGADGPDLLALALPELVARVAPVSPIFVLSGIIQGSRTAARLCRNVPAGWALYRHGVYRQCSASLSGGFDAWLSRRSANLRRGMRRAVRKASAHGLMFERLRPGPGEVDAVYARMLAIESRSWKGLGHCGMAETPSLEFYQEMLRLLAPAGAALVIIATIDGEDAGFIFGGLAGPYYRGQQFSYAQAYAQLSLGNLLQQEKIRWLCELGIARYDLGPVTGPRMEYKYHWSEQNQEFQTWILRRES